MWCVKALLKLVTNLMVPHKPKSVKMWQQHHILLHILLVLLLSGFSPLTADEQELLKLTTRGQSTLRSVKDQTLNSYVTCVCLSIGKVSVCLCEQRYNIIQTLNVCIHLIMFPPYFTCLHECTDSSPPPHTHTPFRCLS